MRISVTWIPEGYRTREYRVKQYKRTTFQDFQKFSPRTVGKWITIAKRDYLERVKKYSTVSSW